MRIHLSFALAAVLIATPAMAQRALSPKVAPHAGADLTDAQAFSALAGKIVGAASECDTISKDRVSAATKKVASITSSVAANDDELSAAAALFAEAADAGKAAVRSGNANCRTVELSLAKLEHIDAGEDEDEDE
jgi:uncharacterized protein (DUF1810 family)